MKLIYKITLLLALIPSMLFATIDELKHEKIKKINKRRKDERDKEKEKSRTVDLHGGSNVAITTAGVDLPAAGVKRISPTEVEVDTIFGPSVTNIKDYSGPASRDSHIQVVDDLEGGILWEPRMNGADQIILLKSAAITSSRRVRY